jgi:hypothetical protein
VAGDSAAGGVAGVSAAGGVVVSGAVVSVSLSHPVSARTVTAATANSIEIFVIVTLLSVIYEGNNSRELFFCPISGIPCFGWAGIDLRPIFPSTTC